MAVWTPADITTALWLDAADASTLTINTYGRAEQWRDKSGHARHAAQGTIAYQPVLTVGGLNSLDVLAFAGDGDNLSMAATAATLVRNVAAITCFAVASNDGGHADRAVFSASVGGTVRRFGVYYHAGSASTGYRRRDADTEQSVSVAQGGGWSILMGQADYASAALAIGIDGVITPRSGGFQTAGNTSDTSSTSVSIGGVGIGVARWLGKMAELVIVQGVPSTETRQKIEGYLAHKWGLAGNLPSSHPYKSEAFSFLSFSPAVHEISATGISKFALGNITSPVGAIVAEREFTPITGTGDVVQPRPEISGYGGVFRDGIALSPPKHEVSSRGTADIVSWGRSRQASRVSGQGHGNVLVRGWMAQSLPGISGAALVSAMGEGRVSGRQLVSSSGEINPNIAAGTMRFRQPAGSISAASMLLASCNGAFSVGRPSVRAAGELAVSCVGRVTSRRAGISAATAIATPSLVFSRDSRFAPTVSASSPVNILRFERS